MSILDRKKTIVHNTIMKLKTTCLGCGKRFSDTKTLNGIERKYCSYKCSKEHKKELARLQKWAIKEIMRLGVRERKAIRYIYKYLHPEKMTDTQIKDVASSFYADWEAIKKKLPLEKHLNASGLKQIIDNP